MERNRKCYRAINGGCTNDNLGKDARIRLASFFLFARGVYRNCNAFARISLRARAFFLVFLLFLMLICGILVTLRREIYRFFMGKILDYIQLSGDGKYLCYKTKKFSLDNSENDTIAYNDDDKTPSVSRKSDFAETNQSRQKVVYTSNSLSINTSSIPIFRYFLDGSRHTYKVDDIAIGNKIFPIVAGQVIVGCCERHEYVTL
jgi:hypothetical protein